MMKYSIVIATLALSFFANLGFAHKSTSLSVHTAIGNPCSNHRDCGDDLYCLSEKETRKGARFIGGYCVKFDCSYVDPCEAGSRCVEPEETDFSLCLASCSSDTHCRNGYACHEDGVCLPATN